MSEYLKCECPHCGQAIEYPSEGTGQTVPCPTCNQPVFLTPSEPPMPKVAVPPVIPPAPAPAVTVSKPATSPPPDLQPSAPAMPKITVPPVVASSPASAMTVPKPTSPPLPDLKPSEPPVPKLFEPPVVSPVPVPPVSMPAQPVPALPNPPPSEAGRFEQACREFESDREFEKQPPTREQIARALVLAKFNQPNPSELPTHIEVVAALKKLFPEFKKH